MLSATMSLGKNELVKIAKNQMAKHLSAPVWTTQQKLALTCRILFLEGHDSGLAGQITARGGEKGTYYTQRLGLGFDEVSSSNLMLVNEDLEVLDGEGMANPANRFHSWIYRARPDVQCIIHTHPVHLSALAMLGQPLKVAHMDSCMLFEDVAFLEKWPGVPVGNDEGEIIATVLGKKRAALLANHGIVVAAHSIEEACMFTIQCERTAKLQLLAEAAGTIQELDPCLAREAHDWILTEHRSVAGFHYYARRMLRVGPLSGTSPFL